MGASVFEGPFFVKVVHRNGAAVLQLNLRNLAMNSHRRLFTSPFFLFSPQRPFDKLRNHAAIAAFSQRWYFLRSSFLVSSHPSFLFPRFYF